MSRSKSFGQRFQPFWFPCSRVRVDSLLRLAKYLTLGLLRDSRFHRMRETSDFWVAISTDPTELAVRLHQNVMKFSTKCKHTRLQCRIFYCTDTLYFDTLWNIWWELASRKFLYLLTLCRHLQKYVSYSHPVFLIMKWNREAVYLLRL